MIGIRCVVLRYELAKIFILTLNLDLDYFASPASVCICQPHKSSRCYFCWKKCNSDILWQKKTFVFMLLWNWIESQKIWKYTNALFWHPCFCLHTCQLHEKIKLFIKIMLFWHLLLLAKGNIGIYVSVKLKSEKTQWQMKWNYNYLRKCFMWK